MEQIIVIVFNDDHGLAQTGAASIAQVNVGMQVFWAGAGLAKRHEYE